MYRAVGFPVDRRTWSCSVSWCGASLPHGNFGSNWFSSNFKFNFHSYQEIIRLYIKLLRFCNDSRILTSLFWMGNVTCLATGEVTQLIIIISSSSAVKSPRSLPSNNGLSLVRGENFSVLPSINHYHQSESNARNVLKWDSSKNSFLFVTSPRSTCLRVLTNIIRATWCCTGSSTDWSLLSRSRRR